MCWLSMSMNVFAYRTYCSLSFTWHVVRSGKMTIIKGFMTQTSYWMAHRTATRLLNV